MGKLGGKEKMSKVLTSNQLVEKVKAVANTPTSYKLGTFGNKTSDGKKLWDCSGLLKGILWGYPSNGKYGSNGVLDQNADTIISKCEGVSTNFNNIQAGEVVWMKGHMGIYIGNGKVIEATPKWENGVQITTCGNVASGSKSRKWTKHGKSQYIDYGNTIVTPTPQPTPNDDWVNRLNAECARQGFSSYPTVKKGAKGGITRLIQERLNSVGFSLTIDGDFGTNTYNAVKVFQRNRGLSQDGIVGKNTWSYLVSGKRY